MRILVLFAALAVSTAAFADDTKPPQISDVKASVKSGKVQVEARITDETGVLSAVVHHRGTGGKVEDTPMSKDEYSDVFKATFPGSGETEYWIESTDLLGNGPSTYGSQSKPMALGGKTGGGKTVATRETPPREETPKEEAPKEETPRPPREHRERHAKATEPPVIEHRAPSAQPPEGRDFTVRMKIKSESPIGVAILQVKPQGGQGFTPTRLTHTEGDSWEGVIPADKAKGTIEYFIAAKNDAGLLGTSGSANDPHRLTFKASAASTQVAAAQAPATTQAAGPYNFSHLPLYRVQPGKPITVRAQVVPTNESGDLPEHVAVLWRGNDAQDQLTDMDPDPTGGYGGFKAQLPPQDEGAIFYQIVACDAAAKSCGDDTGSKRKWHSAMVSAQPGGAQPMPLDAVSSKAPPSLPE
jgi:hypothetical protein